MELATAHDIKPCTALNQSTNDNHKTQVTATSKTYQVCYTYVQNRKISMYMYIIKTSSNFLGLFIAT